MEILCVFCLVIFWFLWILFVGLRIALILAVLSLTLIIWIDSRIEFSVTVPEIIIVMKIKFK